MASQRFAQLQCDGCTATYPEQPVPKTAKALRVDAAQAGWEVLRHTTGRDFCPPCRVREIETAVAGTLPVALTRHAQSERPPS